MTNGAHLELADIQSGILSPRPTPYAATYLILRVDDRGAGRALFGRLTESIRSESEAHRRADETSVNVALTYRGLEALGVPGDSLESFAWEFRKGMAARAESLGDIGDSDPTRWERPLGTLAAHIIVVGVAPDKRRLAEAVARAERSLDASRGVSMVWRQDCRSEADEREHFGYRDGISHPAIEGSGIPGSNPREVPLRPGEFVLGYPDESGGVAAFPCPEVLGRNGTYVAFRKLHQRVAAFRRFLKSNARSPHDEEVLAAKMMGRWRSGAPLALCPVHDDPTLGADPERRNDFSYRESDAVGYATPPGSHIRRANPRDAAVAGVVRLHRMIRRGTVYGPHLSPDSLDDDGVDRGLMFAFVGAHLGRQFEFVQSEWMNDGRFAGLGETADPFAATTVPDPRTFAYPGRPIPRRLRGLPQFVVTRGGEYAFLPSLRAMLWIASLS